MRAIVVTESLPISDERSLIDTEMPDPEIRPTDLLIRVEAVSVNPVDFKQRQRTREGAEPRILGWDGAGVVVAVGDEAHGFEVGDEVWWAGDLTRPGSNADLQAVDYRIVALKPTTASFADAASLPLTALTAWEGMFDCLRINREDDGTLLMVAGAGGVGSIVTQLAKRLTALRVIGTASREESHAWAMRMGADAVADHRDLAASVGELAPEGVDYVFSPYSPDHIRAYAQVTKPYGQIVAIDGDKVDLTPLMPKSIAWHWEFMFTRAMYQTWDMTEQGRILGEVAALVDRGDIVTTATTRIGDFSAAGLREAHRLMETTSVMGKVVVHR